MMETQRNMIQREREREREREKARERVRKREKERAYYPSVIILRVPSINIPDFVAQHRPERDRHIILLSLIL